MTNSMTISQFVNKTGKCGGDCSKFNGKASDFDHGTYNLLKHTTVQIEEEVESLCAAQDLNDSKRNTLVAEREVSKSTLPCCIPFFLDNIVEELTRNTKFIKTR